MINALVWLGAKVEKIAPYLAWTVAIFGGLYAATAVVGN